MVKMGSFPASKPNLLQFRYIRSNHSKNGLTASKPNPLLFKYLSVGALPLLFFLFLIICWSTAIDFARSINAHSHSAFVNLFNCLYQIWLHIQLNCHGMKLETSPILTWKLVKGVLESFTRDSMKTVMWLWKSLTTTGPRTPNSNNGR